MNLEIVKKAFADHFEGECSLYSSPGRINLIGEHTDYNGGFVFPGAVDKCITAAICPTGRKIVRVYSIDFDTYTEFGLEEKDAPKESFAKYIFGVCREMAKLGVKVGAFDCAFSGNVPAGAGMSSSAALSCTIAYAINDIYANSKFDRMTLAKVGQMTEHHYVGVNCGIMDQFISLMGKKGNLVRLDCRSMEYEYFQFDPKGYKLVLIDSVVKHELVGSPYNKRRESCERVAKALGIETLRDAELGDLERIKDSISEEDYKRARYVIGEKQRVLDVCDALCKGDYETVGNRMYQTHWGMSRDYEVSCEELDFLVTLAEQVGVTGSRIMGGGFGGCTINLVKDEIYDRFISTAKKEFAERYGHEPKVYEVVISDGTRKLE